MEYIGEHLWPGRLGHFFLILSLVSSGVAMFSFWLSVRRKAEEGQWAALARWAFRLHSFAVVSAIGVLFYMILNHMFEYDYVWRHSSLDLPLRYIFSCFWEGQEGSFLLWLFWHAVLGNILIHTSRKWEAPVMAVVSLVQLCLGTMLLGIYFGNYQFGSNPFTLIRETAENFGLPWTDNANYLTDFPQFADGRGLNPLLQNYWMTIHPPTLFLGFAAVLVPFAYAVSGLWTRQLKEWIRPALPWALFAVAILGTGILMGGAWAYEALSFGGFWAWDPVENSSLVPWITMVAGLHLMLINRNRPGSLFSALSLVMVSFVLVLYSTFLTRSGVLGESSVHSFVDSGILPQLLVFLLLFPALMVGLFIWNKNENRLFWSVQMLFLLIGIVLTIAGRGDQVALVLIAFVVVNTGWYIRSYYKHFPRPQGEEELMSREFWVFVGSLVLALAALQIIVWTSLPVFNKLLVPFKDFFAGLAGGSESGLWAKLAEARFAPPVDAIAEYNKWQVPFAAVILMLVAVGQFFKYKKTEVKAISFHLLFTAGISLVLTAGIVYATGYSEASFPVNFLLFASLFAIIANFRYLRKIAKGKVKNAGASVAHIGFGLLILGAMTSTGLSERISRNTSIYDVTSLSDDFSNSEDIVMFENDTLRMGNFFVSYRGREKQGHMLYYKMDYYDALPKTFSEGDVVMHKGVLMRAKETHTAERGPRFEQWSIISELELEPGEPVEVWNNAIPGPYAFSLRPSILLNKNMGNSPEPDTRHFLHEDIYTHIVWGRTEDPKADEEGYMGLMTKEMAVGDSIVTMNSVVRLDSLIGEKDREKYGLSSNDLAARAVLRIRTGESIDYAHPLYIIRDQSLHIPDTYEMEEKGLKFTIDKLNPETQTITLSFAEHIRNQRDFVVMKAIRFPAINVLWIGCFVMVVGLVLAMVQRMKAKPEIEE
jgi:cytochrome c-type biogenesis protein CcmF